MSTINSFESHVLRQFLVRLQSVQNQDESVLLYTNPTVEKKKYPRKHMYTKNSNIGQEVPQVFCIFS